MQKKIPTEQIFAPYVFRIILKLNNKCILRCLSDFFESIFVSKQEECNALIFFQSIVLKNVEMTLTKIISSLSTLKIHHLFELWNKNAAIWEAVLKN